MNSQEHYTERKEDLRDRADVASVHRLDFSIIKWMGGILTGILAFLAIQVYNDHTTLASMTQWQMDYGQKIDNLAGAVNSLETQKYTPMQLPMNVSLGSTTAKLNI